MAERPKAAQARAMTKGDLLRMGHLRDTGGMDSPCILAGISFAVPVRHFVLAAAAWHPPAPLRAGNVPAKAAVALAEARVGALPGAL